MLEEGATSRDIYLPAGSWKDEADPNHPEFVGPTLLEDYQADLFTLPYFTRISEKNEARMANKWSHLALTLMLAVAAAFTL